MCESEKRFVFLTDGEREVAICEVETATGEVWNPKERSFSSVTVPIFEDSSTVFVMNRERKPYFWKFPGGRVERLSGFEKHPIVVLERCHFETPHETASRELFQETGIYVPPEKLVLLTVMDKYNHDLYFFGVILPVPVSGSPKITIDHGDEGEEIGVFELYELEKMVDFLPPHREMIKSPEVVAKLASGALNI